MLFESAGCRGCFMIMVFASVGSLGAYDRWWQWRGKSYMKERESEKLLLLLYTQTHTDLLRSLFPISNSCVSTLSRTPLLLQSFAFVCSLHIPLWVFLDFFFLSFVFTFHHSLIPFSFSNKLIKITLLPLFLAGSKKVVPISHHILEALILNAFFPLANPNLAIQAWWHEGDFCCC